MRWGGAGAASCAVALSLFAAGCGCKNENLCPERFDASSWCADTDRCTLESMSRRPCDSPVCEVPKDDTMFVPVADFFGELGTRRQAMVVFYATGLPGTIEPVTVTLDGIVGTLTDIGGARLSTDFTPYPVNPQLLEFRYEGTTPLVGVGIRFHDAECERDHPSVTCPK